MLNKADIMNDEDIEKLRHELLAVNRDVFVVSAVTGRGIRELLNYVYKKIDEIPPVKFELNIIEDTGFDDNDDSDFEVVKLNKNTYSVDGGKIRRLVSVVDIKNTQQVRRLTNILDSMGVFDELNRKGLKEGDTIYVAHMEMNYTGEYDRRLF